MKPFTACENVTRKGISEEFVGLADGVVTTAVGAVVSLYLNCFVLVVQAFLKVPALHELAPEGNEPAFVLTQGLVLVLFVIAGFLAVRRFRPAAAQPALAV